MAILTKHQEKVLSSITPHINDIQKTIDKHLVGGRYMTAAVIIDTFKKENTCEINHDTLVTAFRLAVGAGKITGIVGARRHGYKRIGCEASPSKSPEDKTDNALALISPYLDNLQIWVDDRIQGEVRMTAAVIYKKFHSEKGCDLSEDDFIKQFRLAVKEGKLTGLESARKFGYKRAGENSDAEEATEETDISNKESDSCEIIIDNNRKLVASDRFNWSYAVKRGAGWHVVAWFGATPGMVKSLVRKLIDEEFKNLESFHLAELPSKIDEVEDKLTNLLLKAMSRDTESKEEQDAA